MSTSAEYTSPVLPFIGISRNLEQMWRENTSTAMPYRRFFSRSGVYKRTCTSISPSKASGCDASCPGTRRRWSTGRKWHCWCSQGGSLKQAEKVDMRSSVRVCRELGSIISDSSELYATYRHTFARITWHQDLLLTPIPLNTFAIPRSEILEVNGDMS